MWCPSAVADLTILPLLPFRACASAVLGRPMVCRGGGRAPGPILFAKELDDVLLDEPESSLELDTDDENDVFLGSPVNVVALAARFVDELSVGR